MTEFTDYWYDEHWKKQETPEFLKWWYESYGVITDFDTDNESEVEEYFLRQGFALMGWLARKVNDNNSPSLS